MSIFISLRVDHSQPLHCRCLAHVVNLGTIDFMSHITKIAAVETATAIWEYDPSLPGNRVLGHSLDVISAIRTLAIKVWSVYCRLTVYYSPPRSSRQDSASSISRSSSCSAASRPLSKFLSMVTPGGVPHSTCSVEHISSNRSVFQFPWHNSHAHRDIAHQTFYCIR